MSMQTPIISALCVEFFADNGVCTLGPYLPGLFASTVSENEIGNSSVPFQMAVIVGSLYARLGSGTRTSVALCRPGASTAKFDGSIWKSPELPALAENSLGHSPYCEISRPSGNRSVTLNAAARGIFS